MVAYHIRVYLHLDIIMGSQWVQLAIPKMVSILLKSKVQRVKLELEYLNLHK